MTIVEPVLGQITIDQCILQNKNNDRLFQMMSGILLTEKNIRSWMLRSISTTNRKVNLNEPKLKKMSLP